MTLTDIVVQGKGGLCGTARGSALGADLVPASSPVFIKRNINNDLYTLQGDKNTVRSFILLR